MPLCRIVSHVGVVVKTALDPIGKRKQAVATIRGHNGWCPKETAIFFFSQSQLVPWHLVTTPHSSAPLSNDYRATRRKDEASGAAPAFAARRALGLVPFARRQ